MRKDIEWLVQMIDSERESLRKRFESGKGTHNETAFNEGMGWALSKVLKMIYQLDKPEALSQEWIRNNQERKGVHFFVNVTKLQNLLVPKQEITFGQAHDKLREESILSEKSFDYYWNCINDNVEIDEPGNLLVPKQEELETKIHELIESYKQEEDAYSNPENGWISGFIEDLKNLVEKEQKYYVLDSEDIPLLERVGNQVQKATSELSIYEKGRDNSRFKLTEQEIKKYDVRFWPFAEPVEQADFRLSF